MLPMSQSPLNLTGIDQNLEAIRTLEGSWSLPSLPDEVKFDLASSPTLGTASLAAFMLGIETDLRESERQEPYRVSNPGIWTPENPLYSPGQQAGRLIGGITGDGAPEIYSPHAAQEWKRRAVEQGYLDLTQDEINSPTWRPEYSSIAYTMRRQDMRDQFAGLKPGSVGTSTAMELIEQWVTPRGLYRATVNLDLIPDVGNVVDEAQEWGDKWRHWNKHKTSPSALIDAMTGPLDDVLFPIINDILLFTGVAEVFWFAKGVRALSSGYKGVAAGTQALAAVEQARAVSGLYRGMDALSFVAGAGGRMPRVGEYARKAFVAPDLATDVARFKNQSFIGTALRPHGGRPVGEASSALRSGRWGRGVEAFRASRPIAGERLGAATLNAAWREKSAVMLAKKANQQIMRLGITSNVEGLVDDRSGHSLASMTSMDDYVNAAFANPAVDWAVDLTLFPPNIFEKGTIKRTVGLIAATGRALTVPPSKIPGLGNIRWSNVSSNQQLLMAYNRPMIAEITDTATAHALANDLDVTKTVADEVRLWNQNVSRHGMQYAMAQHWTGGDLEELGKMMGVTTAMAAIDSTARMGGALGETPELLMSYADRVDYLSRMDKIKSQIEIVDLTDIDDIIDIAARHAPERIGEGARLVEASTTISRTGSKKAYRAQALRDEMTETAVEAAARGTGVQDRHVRIFGWVDPDDSGEILWSVNQADALHENPYVIDVALDELVYIDGFETAALADDALRLNPEAAGTAFMRRWRVADTKGVSRQMRLSDLEGHRQYVQSRMRNFQVLASDHNAKRKGFLTEVMNNVNPAMVEAYYHEVMPNFGRFHAWEEGMDEVDRLIALGQLDNARYAPAYSPSGQRISLFPSESIEGVKFTEHVDNMLLQIPRDSRPLISIQSSMFDPMIKHVDPSRAKFTIAHVDTVTKTEALGFRAGVKRAVENVKMLQRLRAVKDLDKLMVDAADEVTKSQARLATATSSGARNSIYREIAEGLAAEHHLSTSDVDRVRKLLGLADEYGVTMEQVERRAGQALREAVDDPLWATRYGVAGTTGRRALADVDPLDIVTAKLKELQRQMNFMASEVTDIPAGLVEHLAGRGYKVVHGVQFAHVRDVRDLVGPLGDAGRGHLRQATLQSFFQRKDPDIMRRLKARQMRSSLYGALRRYRDKYGPEKIREAVGGTFEESDADISRVMDDLHDVLRVMHDDMAHGIDEAAKGGMSAKLGVRQQQLRTPMSIDRLVSDMPGRRRFISAMTSRGYSKESSMAILEGVQASRALGFKEYGLYNLEEFLRSKPTAISGLRLIGRHGVAPYVQPGAKGPTKGALNRARAKGGAAGMVGVAGGITGGAVVRQEYESREGDDANVWGGRAAFAAGTALGLAGAHTLTRAKSMPLPGTAKRLPLLGAAPTEATGLIAGGPLAKWANAWNESDTYLRWAYMADGLANMRDIFRFSLSPIFDASRYSEAVVLGQLARAELPPGMGNLAINQSPRAFKRSLWRHQVHDLGKSKDEADAIVGNIWNEKRAEFAAAARHDFEAETIDAIGRRFATVGILGFSPAEWMTAMFANLRIAGVDSRKAYEITRAVHTYGVTGRSSAEMSMNFVFFPFSFTKKMLTHMGRFVSEDMGRLVVMHDMMKTYEMLNEHYDLSEEFRDRAPILNRMARMNVLAYGVGPGRFGGVNAAWIEAARDLPIVGDVMYPGLPEVDEIQNLFMPQSVVMNEANDADLTWNTVRKALPAINDIQQLTDDMMQQLHVVTGSNHMVAEAEERRAWDEWKAYQATWTDTLRRADKTWSQAMYDEDFAEMARAKRAEIGIKYPSWKQAMGDGIAHVAAIDAEINERLRSPQGDVDGKLQRFVKQFTYMSEEMSKRGMSFDNPDEVPPDVYRILQDFARELAKDDPAFLRLYNRFYKRTLGPITLELIDE